MLDRRRRDELEGVLALGRLSEQMVFTLGRALRSEPLQPEDQPVLEAARRLFELMAEQDVIVLDVTDDRMVSDESYLDALHVVELQANGEDVEEQANRYVELLKKVATDAVTDDERDELVALRELFSAVGEATLAHANELSQPRQEPSWRLMRQATSRF